MSHDTDKLIRQLSLVAFLMAERRPLTARDVKGNVEGYSEMSDEAFARRFYSDRAELTGLGVPLHSHRDEFTGEELYTLRSENYFLDRLDLKDDELAALQTALFYLDGKFAYAEPLRLALQNLALGRPGFHEARTDTAERVRVSAPDYSPELAGRLSKLESAISKQRTIKFSYWSPQRDKIGERTLNPYALRLDEGIWYVVGQDLDRAAVRTFRVSRIRSDIRFATRRERDFRLPPEFDVEAHRVPRPWQIGEIVGKARIGVQGDTAWWVHRTLADAGTLEDGVYTTDFARIEPLAGWVLRQNGRAVPLEPKALRDAVADGLTLLRAGHGGDGPGTRSRASTRTSVRSRRPPGRADRARAVRRPAGAARPRPLRLRRGARRSARRRRPRVAVLDPTGGAAGHVVAAQSRQLRRRVLHGVRRGRRGQRRRARRQGALRRRVPAAPKLTPLEARAIRLAIDYVGPTIAAEAHTPLDRVRKKLEETFGQFDLPNAPTGDAEDVEEKLVRTLSDAVEKRRVVEIEYLKEGDEGPTTRSVEPYSFERELPVWRVHTWDRTADGPRTYRLDRMRSARLTDELFEPRDGLRSSVSHRAAARAALALARRGSLEGGARSARADRQGGRLGAALQDRRMAAVGGARRCRRDDRARACRHAGERRVSGSRAPGRARPQGAPEAPGSTSLNVEP